MASEGLNWTEKYRPQSLTDVQGNNNDIREIKKWAEEWTPGSEALLLIGPPGVGKTATAHALATDMGWSMTDINASSERTSDAIEEIAAKVRHTPVDGTRDLLFLDEVDSFARQASLQPLIDLLDEPPAPIILAGNEEWKIPASITRRARQFEFSLGKRSIKARLKQICDEEDVGISSMDLGKLATRGNLRAAINDLQQYAETGELEWDQRQTSIDNFDAVDNVLRGKRYTGDMTPEALVHWLDENLATEFRGVEAAMAYDALSRADTWLGRVQETGDYHWWRYAGRLADQTAALRLTEPYSGYLHKSYPQHFRESTPTPTDGSPEAALYRVLKGYDTGEFGFAGDYHYFRRTVLPQLRAIPLADRRQLAVEHGIQPGDAALSALDLADAEFEQWLHEEFDIDADDSPEQSLLGTW